MIYEPKVNHVYQMFEGARKDVEIGRYKVCTGFAQSFVANTGTIDGDMVTGVFLKGSNGGMPMFMCFFPDEDHAVEWLVDVLGEKSYPPYTNRGQRHIRVRERYSAEFEQGLRDVVRVTGLPVDKITPNVKRAVYMNWNRERELQEIQ